jgi:hypothetical protein
MKTKKKNVLHYLAHRVFRFLFGLHVDLLGTTSCQISVDIQGVVPVLGGDQLEAVVPRAEERGEGEALSLLRILPQQSLCTHTHT